MNRRSFIRNLAGIGLCTILPGAGRIWVARQDLAVVDTRYRCIMLPPPKYKLVSFWYETGEWADSSPLSHIDRAEGTGGRP